MNALGVAWGLAITSIIVSFAGSPEVGLFLAAGAGSLAIIAVIDASPARRDAQQRNHARRK